MQELLKKWMKHIVALLILLIATVAYFSPSVGLRRKSFEARR